MIIGHDLFKDNYCRNVGLSSGNAKVSFGNHENLFTRLAKLELVGQNLRLRDGADSYTPSKPKEENMEDNSSYISSHYITDEEFESALKQNAKRLEEQGIKVNYMDKCASNPKLFDIDVDGENYKIISSSHDAFAAMEEMLDYENGLKNKEEHSLSHQILNIKDCARGRFVKTSEGEKLIPYLLREKPSVDDNLLIDYGNMKDPERFPDCVRKYAILNLSNNLGKNIDENEVRLIEYLEKKGYVFPYEGDNTVRKLAVAYYDEDTNQNCIYYCADRKVEVSERKS